MAPYRRIIDEISTLITRGTWPPGHRLPSRYVLAQMYGCSPATVQKALAVLEGAGLVAGQQGRGVFVTDPRT